MRPSLSSLPAELIDHIISSIQQPHLVNLALVSQEFNAFTTPHLYRDVHLKRQFFNNGSTEHLLPFMFLVLQKPRIASLVHFFTLSYQNEGSEREPQYSWPGGSGDLHNALKPVIEAAAHSSEAELELINLVLGESTAVLTLLLPALHKLRRLSMTFGAYNDDGDDEDKYVLDKYLSPLLQRAGARQTPFDTHPGFTELTDIMINGYGRENFTRPDSLLACCTLPAVERIYGHGLRNEPEDDVTRLMAKLPTKSWNIVSIELRRSKLHPAVFSKLLAACKKLKTLIYELYCTSWVWDLVHIHGIRDALEPHEEWMEELCLVQEYSYDCETDGELVALSFKAFKSLKHLKVAAVYLFGHQSSCPMSSTRLVGRLPESLHKLHITFGGHVLSLVWVADALEELLRWSEMSVPNLKELVLEGEFEGCENTQALLDGLARILRVADAKHIKTVVLHVSLHVSDECGVEERAWGIDEKVRWGGGIAHK